MSGRVRGPGRVRPTENAVAWWWWPADLGLLGALVVLGSALIVSTYGSPAPMSATATGALVAVGVLVGVRRLRLPGWVTVPFVAVGVVLLGALVVAPGPGRFPVLPTALGMGTVLRGAVEGWRELLTVATPTGVTGGLLVPPLVIGAVATGLAGWAASGRRPQVALAVPAGAAVLFALLGDTTAGRGVVVLVGCGGVVVGVSWLVWVGARTRRRQVARFSGGAAVRRPSADLSPESWLRRRYTARRAAVATAVLAVACTVGALVAVAATPTRLALRDLAPPSVDPAGFVSPLSTFRAYTGERAEDVQLAVEGLVPGSRLRLATMDAYDGRLFSVSDAAGPFVRIGRYRPQAEPAAGETVEVGIVVDEYSGPYLPLPGQITEVAFTGPRADALADDLRYSDGAATGLLPGGWQSGDSYTVVATMPVRPTAEQLAAAEVPTVDVPDAVVLPEVLRAAANRYVAGVSGAAARVEAIRAGLAADGVFSHGSPEEPRSASGHGLDRLTAMVTGQSMVGDQEQYAALLALLVRSVGVPARVGVGFVVPPPDTADAGDDAGSGSSADTEHWTELRGRDISAWVEVPLAGLGWVVFDPTPAADKPPAAVPERSQADRRAVAAEVPPALQAGQPESLDADSAGQRSDIPDGDDAGAGASPGWPMLLLAVLGWLALALAVVAVPVALILAVKGRARKRRRTGDPREQITGGWEHLVGVAIDAGYRPAPWRTRSETAAELAAGGLLVDWLAPAADAAEFAPGPQLAGAETAATEETAAAFWREVDDRSAELLAGLPLWRRWRARLSLASMRRLDRNRG